MDFLTEHGYGGGKYDVNSVIPVHEFENLGTILDKIIAFGNEVPGKGAHHTLNKSSEHMHTIDINQNIDKLKINCWNKIYFESGLNKVIKQYDKDYNLIQQITINTSEKIYYAYVLTNGSVLYMTAINSHLYLYKNGVSSIILTAQNIKAFWEIRSLGYIAVIGLDIYGTSQQLTVLTLNGGLIYKTTLDGIYMGHLGDYFYLSKSGGVCTRIKINSSSILTTNSYTKYINNINYIDDEYILSTTSEGGISAFDAITMAPIWSNLTTALTNPNQILGRIILYNKPYIVLDVVNIKIISLIDGTVKFDLPREQFFNAYEIVKQLSDKLATGLYISIVNVNSFGINSYLMELMNYELLLYKDKIKLGGN